MTEKKDEIKQTNKWVSRKFIVWFAWLIFCGISAFNEKIPCEKCFEYFGIVSMFYIGANAVGDFAPWRKNNNGVVKNDGPEV